MHGFVKWLSYSRVRFLSRLFSGAPRLLLEADPVVQKRLIDKCERRIYGPEGLASYERREPLRWKRLARRTLAQYLGQCEQTESRAVRCMRSIVFAAALPLLLAFLLVRTWRSRNVPPSTLPADTVVFLWVERLQKFVWPGMFGERPFLLHTGQQVHLGRAEVRFVARVVRECPRMLLHPALLCNVVRWLAHYGFAVRHFRPSRVAHFFENTAASSVMTAYLGEHGISHCDIQHGEIVMSAFCAFTEFDEYRLWGQHFAELLETQLSAGRVQVVGVPLHRDLFHRVRPARQPRPARLLIIDPFLHRLEWDPDPHFLRLLRHLDGTWEVLIRRHPADKQLELGHVVRWNSDPELMRRGVRLTEERPDQLPIQDALERSFVVAGVSSAALLEAWIAGCKVVYVPGGPSRASVMERHRGSPNICHLADHSNLHQFLSTPTIVDETEARRIDYLTAVLDGKRSGDGASGSAP